MEVAWRSSPCDIDLLWSCIGLEQWQRALSGFDPELGRAVHPHALVSLSIDGSEIPLSFVKDTLISAHH